MIILLRKQKRSKAVVTLLHLYISLFSRCFTHLNLSFSVCKSALSIILKRIVRMLRRSHSVMVKRTKVLFSGESFSSTDNFPDGQLPTKRQVIERVLHEDNFLQKAASSSVAKELVERWIWCNVYPVHAVTVANKIFEMVTKFTKLDRWPKKSRGSETFKRRETDFTSKLDDLFDIFCFDDAQRLELEKQHGLKMTEKIILFIMTKNLNENKNA